MFITVCARDRIVEFLHIATSTERDCRQVYVTVAFWHVCIVYDQTSILIYVWFKYYCGYNILARVLDNDWNVK